MKFLSLYGISIERSPLYADVRMNIAAPLAKNSSDRFFNGFPNWVWLPPNLQYEVARYLDGSTRQSMRLASKSTLAAAERATLHLHLATASDIRAWVNGNRFGSLFGYITSLSLNKPNDSDLIGRLPKTLGKLRIVNSSALTAATLLYLEKLSLKSLALGNADGLMQKDGLAASATTSLQALHLQNQRRRPLLIEHFSPFTLLQKLSLKSVLIQYDRTTAHALTEKIARHSQLTSLDLSGNFLTGINAATLANTSSIRKMVLNDNLIDLTGFGALVANTGIQRLSLKRNDLDGKAVPTSLSENSTLRQLDLGLLAVPGSAKALAQHPTLRSLSLTLHFLREDFLKEIWKNTILSALKIRRTVVNSSSIEGITPHPSINTFSFVNSAVSPSVALAFVNLGFKKLTFDLNTESDFMLTVEGPDEYAAIQRARNFHDVQAMTLSGNIISEDHLQTLPHALTSLRIRHSHNVDASCALDNTVRILNNTTLLQRLDWFSIV